MAVSIVLFGGTLWYVAQVISAALFKVSWLFNAIDWQHSREHAVRLLREVGYQESADFLLVLSEKEKIHWTLNCMGDLLDHISKQ